MQRPPPPGCPVPDGEGRFPVLRARNFTFINVLLDSTSKMMDGKKLSDMKLPFATELVAKKALKKVEGTVVEDLLKRYNLI